jgi:flagellar biogenesis protein FliO
MSIKAKALILFSLVFAPLFSETPPPSPSITHIETPAAPEHALVSKAPESSYENALIKMILTLGGLLLLVFLTLWILRKLSNGRMGGFGTAKKIKVLEKRPLSPKTVIYLLELNGKEVFVAESQLEVKTILSSCDIDHELD